jgi:ATP-dependent RNA helicase RhlE
MLRQTRHFGASSSRNGRGFSSSSNSRSGGRGSSFGSGFPRARSGGRSRGRFSQYIDPNRFIKKADFQEQRPYDAINQFADFDIHDLLKRNITAKGYQTPLPIQDQTIPHALQGKDIVGIANTGTGKTAAFVIPLLHKLLTDKSQKMLIVAPTRELAQQIENEVRTFAKGSGLSGALLIGGSSMQLQYRALRNNPNIIIGTPGRIKDHVMRNSIKLSTFSNIVLDEVDRMLDMGFIDDITELLSQLATPRQSLFFTATLDEKIKVLVQKFSNNPLIISVKTGETSSNVNQNVIKYISETDRLEKLHEALNHVDAQKIIIFDETQRSVEKLKLTLEDRGFKVDAIHGGKSQGQRQRALVRFKRNEVKVLVATDVAARGLDITDITHVINFTTPNTYDDYIHRIGRAGRAGRVGYAFTFVKV